MISTDLFEEGLDRACYPIRTLPPEIHPQQRVVFALKPDMSRPLSVNSSIDERDFDIDFKTVEIPAQTVYRAAIALEKQAMEKRKAERKRKARLRIRNMKFF